MEYQLVANYYVVMFLAMIMMIISKSMCQRDENRFLHKVQSSLLTRHPYLMSFSYNHQIYCIICLTITGIRGPNIS